MKLRVLVPIIAAGVFLSSAALAAPFTLFGTGVAATGLTAPTVSGSVDLHYKLDGGDAILVSQVGFPASAWTAGSTLTSRFIGDKVCGLVACDAAVTTFVYTTTFSLAGFDASTAVIKLKYASDNSVSIKLNTTATGLPTQSFTSLSAEQTISAGFVAGDNTLTFSVVNGGGPQGLQVQITSTDATAYCTGDFGALTAHSCADAAAPFCSTNGSCVATCVNGPGTCTTTSSTLQTSITHTGPLCNPTSGACQLACVNDGQCTTGQACVAGACVAGCRGTGGNACAGSNVCTSTDATVGACVQCTSNAQCGGNKPTCTLGSCVACTSDNAVIGNACPSSSNPYCTSGGSCGKCTQSSDCTALGAIHAGTSCNATSGACQSGCFQDSDCTNGYCSQAVCIPKRANSNTIPGSTQQPVPGRNGGDPVLNGDCTTASGTAACLSNVCFASDDLCGLPNGENCNGIAVCRSAICAADGKCGRANGGACIVGSDCRSGICNALVCVTTADAGTDSGSDAGRDGATDGSVADSGSDTGSDGAVDGSTVDGSTVDSGQGGNDSGTNGNNGSDDGNLEGGGISCSSSPTSSASAIPALVGLAFVLTGFARRRRQ